MVGMEGELTLPECLIVLKNMSNGKSPCLDGITSELKLNTESALLEQNNNNGMTLLGFKTILHKKCRFGKNSEGPAENSWVLDLCPAK
jgi:hypothetical protein